MLLPNNFDPTPKPLPSETGHAFFRVYHDKRYRPVQPCGSRRYFATGRFNVSSNGFDRPTQEARHCKTVGWLEFTLDGEFVQWRTHEVQQ